MEEIVEYTFSDIVLPKVEFMAKFDPNTGAVISVGPSIAFVDDKFKLPIDEEIALQIIEGKMFLSSCVVNLDDNCVEISEVKSLFKIDDVLHRITEEQFVDFDIADVCVTYSNQTKKFTFELIDTLGGTMKSSKVTKKKRSIIWGGETLMGFYITDYNDPNVLYQKIEIKLLDLQENKILIKQEVELPKKFSIYTRRLFKNYMVKYESN